MTVSRLHIKNKNVALFERFKGEQRRIYRGRDEDSKTTGIINYLLYNMQIL